MRIWHENYTLEHVIALRDNNLNRHLGIKFTEINDNSITATMPVEDFTRQSRGVLHGGASCVLAESVASFAAFLCINPEKKNVVGLNLNANHLKSIKDGFVYATAKPIHVGNSTSVWDIEITNENKDLISIVKFTAMHKDINK